MAQVACILSLFAALLAACGQPARGSKAPPSKSSKPAASDDGYRAPSLAWWRGREPRCSMGTLERRDMSWGAVYWCAIPGHEPDANLQNDLGRIAECVHGAAKAFKVAPDPDRLGDFLSQAHKAGTNAGLCTSIRAESDLRTYHGLAVQAESHALPPREAVQGEPETAIVYRFGCEGCMVAAETRFSVPYP